MSARSSCSALPINEGRCCQICDDIIVTPVRMLAATLHVRAGDNNDRDRDNDHNYIIERQQAYQVEGVPTSRIIDGDREIDIYSNGQMFEGNQLVGQQKGSYDDDDDYR
jgi:hypothetical protein